MTVSATLISCTCSVVTIIISMITVYKNFIKTTVTKEDLDKLVISVNDLDKKVDDKFDAMNTSITSIDKRLVIVEYIAGVSSSYRATCGGVKDEEK